MRDDRLLEVSVSINTAGIKRFTAEVRQGLRNHTGPFGQMFTQWAADYAAFTRRRFNTFSRGGGDWKPLARSTALARNRIANAGKSRGGKGGGSAGGVGSRSSLFRNRGGGLSPVFGRNGGARTFSILRDTGTLFNALAIGAKGNYVGRGPGSVVYGLAAIPANRMGGTTTIQKIAHWHNVGAGHLPRRVILAKPDAATQRRLMSRLRTATQAALQVSSRQAPPSAFGGGRP